MSRVLLFLFPLLSCNGGGGPACLDHGDCEGTSICDAATSTCREVGCLTSEDCALGSHCSEELNTCVTGCAQDDDCLAGQSCGQSGQCETYGCRSTQLDCRFGETCNGAGQCVPTTAPHCALANDYTDQLDCTFTHGGTLACFGGIVSGYCTGDTYCLLPCSTTGAECPRGTTCYAPFTNTTQTYCTGDCPYLNANGF